jgi:putative transposase
VRYINKTYRRTGTLWDSRYKSSLVQEDTYLLLCQRYIELNPVRTAMVDDPAHYRWSSHLANALGQRDPLITPHLLYTALAADEASRQACYRALFRHPLDAEARGDIRLVRSQSQPLGNAQFLDTVERVSGHRREAKPRGKLRGQKPESGVLEGQGQIEL